MRSFFILQALAALSQTTVAIMLPPPTGPFGVEIFSQELVDYSRPNPWAAEPAVRSIMVSIFTPADQTTTCNTCSIPYMPSAVARYYDETYSDYGIPNGTFASISLTTCDTTDNARPSYPVLIFSPGLGNSRFLYSAMASQISSFGLIVITVDHPYDAAIVEFPDGSTITATNISTEAEILKALRVRTDDIAFLVSSLLDTEQPVIQKANGKPPLPIMIAGHSLGGATAAEVMLYIPELRTGANLDGTFWGQATHQKSTWSRPFLLFGSENKTTTDATWGSILPRLRAAHAYLELHGSVDGTYTDLPYLVEVFGLRNSLPPAVSKLLGAIDGLDAFKAITDVMVAWFKGIAGANGRAGLRMVRQVAERDSNISCAQC